MNGGWKERRTRQERKAKEEILQKSHKQNRALNTEGAEITESRDEILFVAKSKRFLTKAKDNSKE